MPPILARCLRLVVAAGVLGGAMASAGAAHAQAFEASEPLRLESLALTSSAVEAPPLGLNSAAGTEGAAASLLLGLKTANLATRFGLELGLLGALGYWGFQVGQGPLEKAGLGLGAPLLAAIAWGTFISPKATIPVPGEVRVLMEFALFGAAAAALAQTGHGDLARGFGLTALVSSVLNYVWEH